MYAVKILCNICTCVKLCQHQKSYFLCSVSPRRLMHGMESECSASNSTFDHPEEPDYPGEHDETDYLYKVTTV